MATSCLAPGKQFRNALSSIADRDVEVTLLIGSGEFWCEDTVAQSFYHKLLQSGIKVYEYSKTQLYGKVTVIDDK